MFSVNWRLDQMISNKTQCQAIYSLSFDFVCYCLSNRFRTLPSLKLDFYGFYGFFFLFFFFSVNLSQAAY